MLKQRDGLGGVAALVMALACGAPVKERGAVTLSATNSAEVRAPDPQRIERGRYLVEHVAACPDCHSPRRGHDDFDRERWLSGVDCFVDAAPNDPNAGCLATANLTHHETGLKNRTDQQIKDMFQRGVRPDGKALHPFMPYAYFANMRDSDADAIVAHLRTVEGVDHTSAKSQPPFVAPAQPAPRVDESVIPLPRADYPERRAALRGRYLAGNVGMCLNCHTPRGPNGTRFEVAFQGGMKFDRTALGLPASEQEFVYAANITPHETGILHYTVPDIVRALKHGEDKDQGERLCPPMPAGPRGSFGGMTDADATDIAHYLLSLPPRDHRVPYDCSRGTEAGTP